MLGEVLEPEPRSVEQTGKRFLRASACSHRAGGLVADDAGNVNPSRARARGCAGMSAASTAAAQAPCVPISATGADIADARSNPETKTARFGAE
jgi:hypothetical protein